MAQDYNRGTAGANQVAGKGAETKQEFKADDVKDEGRKAGDKLASEIGKHADEGVWENSESSKGK